MISDTFFEYLCLNVESTGGRDGDEFDHVAATYRGAVLDTRLPNFHEGEAPTDQRTFPRAAKVLHNERFGTGALMNERPC